MLLLSNGYKLLLPTSRMVCIFPLLFNHSLQFSKSHLLTFCHPGVSLASPQSSLSAPRKVQTNEICQSYFRITAGHTSCHSVFKKALCAAFPTSLLKWERLAFGEVVDMQEMRYFLYVLEVLSTGTAPASKWRWGAVNVQEGQHLGVQLMYIYQYHVPPSPLPPTPEWIFLFQEESIWLSGRSLDSWQPLNIRVQTQPVFLCWIIRKQAKPFFFF